MSTRIAGHADHAFQGARLLTAYSRPQFILRLIGKIFSIMALVELARRIALDTIDHAPALDGGTLADLLRPAHDFLVACAIQELACAVQQSLGKRPIPGPDRHVRDR